MRAGLRVARKVVSMCALVLTWRRRPDLGDGMDRDCYWSIARRDEYLDDAEEEEMLNLLCSDCTDSHTSWDRWERSRSTCATSK